MEQKESMKNLIITIAIIVITLLVFYLITAIITNKKENEKNNQNNSGETIIDYETILVSDIYKQSHEAYYILASMPDDKKTSTYQSDLTTYGKKENALPVYKVDLSSALNKNYISENTDLTGKYPIFSETTLLKIENGTITENYQGEDITTFLNTLKE